MGRIRRVRRGLRFWIPLAAAAFAAVMCAGPIGISVPGTMHWAEGLGCPGSQRLDVVEVLDTEVSPAETRQLVYCVDSNGQGTLAGARPFLVMWIGYFAVFLVGAFGMVFAGGRFWQWFFGLPRRPVGWETEREVRALLAQSKREEALALVRAKTGGGPRWARRYVEVMGAQGEGNKGNGGNGDSGE
jgi:hypothetical protein